MNFPKIDEHLPNLISLTKTLHTTKQNGEIVCYEDINQRIQEQYSLDDIKATDKIIPGWERMALNANSKTLFHVFTVFVVLYENPEYQAAPPLIQELMKWIVLFHDIGKYLENTKRDPIHGFTSAVIAANNLPQLGFETTAKYAETIQPWSELTQNAIIYTEGQPDPIQDNSKLPEILAGIDKLFGVHTPAALIVKSVLLHMSLTVLRDWPQAAPLSDQEAKTYITPELFPLLKIIMLIDNDAWNCFSYPEKKAYRVQTLEVFDRISELIKV